MYASVWLTIIRRAIEYLADIRLHRSFTFTPNSETGRTSSLRITFSDLGHQNVEDPADEAVILFCGGMFGSRYVGAGSVDSLAREHGIRLICVDRFGMGGSQNVGLEVRVQTWLGKERDKHDCDLLALT